MPLLAGEKKGTTKARHNVTQRDTTDGTLQPGNDVEGNGVRAQIREEKERLVHIASARGGREREHRRAEGRHERLEHRGPHRAHDAWTTGGGIIVDPLNRSIYNGRK